MSLALYLAELRAHTAPYICCFQPNLNVFRISRTQSLSKVLIMFGCQDVIDTSESALDLLAASLSREGSSTGQVVDFKMSHAFLRLFVPFCDVLRLFPT